MPAWLRPRRATALGALLLLAAAPTSSAVGAAPWFTDVTAAAGVPSLKYGEGVNVVDLDADGLPEIFLPVPRGRSRLLLNRGGLVFEEVSAARGLGEAAAIGATVGDLDADGRPDIYIVRGEHVPGANGLYLQRADGAFTDRAAALGVPGRRNGISALLFDADRDGAADLFLAGWSGNVLYRGVGREGVPAFADTTAEAGLARRGKCWGAVATDFDGDGSPDIVTVCGARGLPEGPRLYRNLGGGTFEDWTARSGIGGIGWALGVVSADFHGRGRFDLFFTSLEGPDRLFRNDGGGRFTDVTDISGVVSGRSVGASAADVDGDLLTDLVVAGFAGPVRLYRNLGGGRFAEVKEGSGIGSDARNEGAVLADLDGDGDPDLYVANFDGRNRLYRNDRGDGRHLRVRFASGGATAVGSVARLYRGGALGRQEALLAARELQGGYGVCSQGPAELTFRLPAVGAVDLSVTFPDGTAVERTGAEPGVVTLDPRPRRP